MADETKRFREKLDALSALAQKNQMKLTVQQVQEILEGEKLPDEKMKLVPEPLANTASFFRFFTSFRMTKRSE